MVEAPEKIWSKATSRYGMVATYAIKPPDEYLVEHTEYIRADIAERQLAEARAELAAVRTELTRAVSDVHVAEAERDRLAAALDDMLFEYGDKYDSECRLKNASELDIIAKARAALDTAKGAGR